MDIPFHVEIELNVVGEQTSPAVQESLLRDKEKRREEKSELKYIHIRMDIVIESLTHHRNWLKHLQIHIDHKSDGLRSKYQPPRIHG